MRLFIGAAGLLAPSVVYASPLFGAESAGVPAVPASSTSSTLAASATPRVIQLTVEQNIVAECKTCPYLLCSNDRTYSGVNVLVNSWTNGTSIGCDQTWLKTKDECWVSQWNFQSYPGNFSQLLTPAGKIESPVKSYPIMTTGETSCNTVPLEVVSEDGRILTYPANANISAVCISVDPFGQLRSGVTISQVTWYKTHANCYVRLADLTAPAGRVQKAALPDCGVIASNLSKKMLQADADDTGSHCPISNFGAPADPYLPEDSFPTPTSEAASPSTAAPTMPSPTDALSSTSVAATTAAIPPPPVVPIAPVTQAPSPAPITTPTAPRVSAIPKPLPQTPTTPKLQPAAPTTLRAPAPAPQTPRPVTSAGPTLPLGPPQNWRPTFAPAQPTTIPYLPDGSLNQYPNQEDAPQAVPKPQSARPGRASSRPPIYGAPQPTPQYQPAPPVEWSLGSQPQYTQELPSPYLTPSPSPQYTRGTPRPYWSPNAQPQNSQPTQPSPRFTPQQVSRITVTYTSRPNIYTPLSPRVTPLYDPRPVRPGMYVQPIPVFGSHESADDTIPYPLGDEGPEPFREEDE